MQQMVRLRDTATLWREIEARGRDLLELTQLAMDEDDSSFQEQLESDTEALGPRYGPRGSQANPFRPL